MGYGNERSNLQLIGNYVIEELVRRLSNRIEV